MTKDPNKNRTEKDFIFQASVLKEIANIMKKNGLPPILSDGLVLGIIRNGDFIPWDFDADFFVESEKAMGKENQIAEDLKKAGYEKIKVRGSLNDWKVCGEKNDYHIDIRGFFRIKDLHISKVRRSNGLWSTYIMPAKFFDHLKEIEFRGEKYFIPMDHEGYLEYIYNDWKKEIRSVKHSEYLNKRFKQEGKI